MENSWSAIKQQSLQLVSLDNKLLTVVETKKNCTFISAVIETCEETEPSFLRGLFMNVDNTAVIHR